MPGRIVLQIFPIQVRIEIRIGNTGECLARVNGRSACGSAGQMTIVGVVNHCSLPLLPRFFVLREGLLAIAFSSCIER